MSQDTARTKHLEAVNQQAPLGGRVRHIETVPFGQSLRIERYQLENGLVLLMLRDPSAPVVSYHTWFRVGSRHERPGKTGLAHLFEHLMFNEVEGLPAGEFDRRMEEAGADSNASTWLDFTQYSVTVPKNQLSLVINLEARRMSQLVLRELQVTSEKEVVANERRYRVDDDVEGTINEVLWKTAFEHHAYHWPTIGFMEDIEGFTTRDCEEFYRSQYAPNNAVVVVVGDFTERSVLSKIVTAYGALPSSHLPLEDGQPEPPQTAERRLDVTLPTPTQKISLGYKGPALGDFDYAPLSLLVEVLFGARSSRIRKKLTRDLEIASEVRAYVGPFRDPGLLEIFASARGNESAERLLETIEEELERVKREPVTVEELEAALARMELAVIGGLESADGKASTIGFYETVLGEPAGAFEALRRMARVTTSDTLRVARRYLKAESRTTILVRSGTTLEEQVA